MTMSLTPFLLAVEIGFLFLAARRAARTSPNGFTASPAYAHFLWISAYGLGMVALGARGFFVSEAILQSYPGVWVQVVTVIAVAGPALLFPSVREALRVVFDGVPWSWFAWFHALRICALGTAYKTYKGEFPVYFEVLVGVPDLAFGVSAVWIARRAAQGRLSRRGFLVWNLLGAFAIVPAAPILLQLGLPGPFQVFAGDPGARAVFTFPMSIAPTIGVPLFVLVNVWAAWRLWERGLDAGAPAARGRGA